MATLLGKSVFWRNKETVSQYDGQNPEPVMFENLVIHFDQEKFEELLSGVVQCSMLGNTGKSLWPRF